jgi:hypothetical protein
MALKKKKKKTSPKKKKVVKRKVAPKRLKRLKKRPARKKVAAKKVKEDIIGRVTHYFPKVRAGVIKLKKPLSIGQTIKIKGHTTDFTQNITSMQIDHVPINSAKKGQEIGLLVNSRVRQHDLVYKA